MKKFIQVCSLFTLLVLFGAASANAQSSLGSEVQIPFAFNVGDQSYEAGHYIFKLQRYSTGTATLSIHDTKNDEVKTVLLNVNGEGPGKQVNLVFDTVGGQKYLTKVRTGDRTFALVKSKSQKEAAKAEEIEKSGASIGGSSSLF